MPATKLNKYINDDNRKYFKIVYLLNTLLMVAFTCQMNFGSYIVSLGGTELMGAWVLAIGFMSGVLVKYRFSKLILVTRLNLLWEMSALSFAIGALMFAFADRMN